MEPVEMALAATAVCLVHSISYNATWMVSDSQGLEVPVKTTLNPRVLFAVMELLEYPVCLGNVQYEVKVSGDVSDEELEKIQKPCVHSPVHGLIAEAINVTGKVTQA